jgi:hypothetical protein
LPIACDGDDVLPLDLEIGIEHAVSMVSTSFATRLISPTSLSPLAVITTSCWPYATPAPAMNTANQRKAATILATDEIDRHSVCSVLTRIVFSSFSPHRHTHSMPTKDLKRGTRRVTCKTDTALFLDSGIPEVLLFSRRSNVTDRFPSHETAEK